MQVVVWWISVVVLAVASGIDVRTRRVPNWLTIPFLASGLVMKCVSDRLPGAGSSLAGIGLAVLLYAVPCFLGGRGMGDLKLAAGVGAWIGPSQFAIATLFSALFGGVFAVGWALWHGSLGRSLDSTAGLLTLRGGFRRDANRSARVAKSENSMPYVPVIAVGTLFSFLVR